MELKKVEREDTGEDTGNVIAREKRRISDDYSRSGTNTSYSGGAAAEWDEKIEKNSFRMTAEDMERALSKTQQEIDERNSHILLAMEIVTYLAFAFLVFMIVRVTQGSSVDIIYNLSPISLATGILTVVLIADAIVSFIFGEKKPLLFVFAIVLSVFYPMYRNKVTNGRFGFGLLATLLVLFSYAMLFVTAGQAVTRYGSAIIYTQDDTTRHAAVDVMDDTYGDGKHLSIAIKALMDISHVEVSDKGKDRIISFSGVGPKTVNIGNMSYTSDTGLIVRLDFRRSDSSEETDTKKSEIEPRDYTLVSVSLDGKELSANERKTFWTSLLTSH